jgi:hypothetical protein
MQESARERKAAARRSRATSAEGGAELQAKIADLSGDERAMAGRIHEIVSTSAGPRPEDVLRMPVYAPGRQGHLLLPAQVEVQGSQLDHRLPAGREAR